ncbi:MAG: hypothetical protein OXP09_20060 [Gammaproteobacteria bacterium]|nr:hypothetical protein [Gammaproteobacteria bacterium]
MPFVLVTTGFIWDLREYVAHRTDLAREMYVVAEVIANETGPDSGDSPFEAAVKLAGESLADGGAGRISVTVVVRGDRRDAAANSAHTDCADENNWCLPRVIDVWPPAPPHADAGKGTWNGGGDCANFEPRRPAVGEHFPSDMPVLPSEGQPAADGQPPPGHELWLSRSMTQQEWWVLVDTCFHANPGLFGGLALRGLEYFDISDSAFVLARRAAWGSVHDYPDCKWCPAR